MEVTARIIICTVISIIVLLSYYLIVRLSECAMAVISKFLMIVWRSKRLISFYMKKHVAYPPSLRPIRDLRAE